VHLKRVAYTETDSGAHTYRIPAHADFLVRRIKTRVCGKVFRAE
jgi:hypothetical protein